MLAALALLLAPLTTAGETDAFRGVGRVAIAGRGFCTGTLISSALVLTAAHCLYDARTLRPVPLRAMRFVTAAGHGAEPTRRRVARAAAAPAFRFDGRPNPRAVAADLALLELAEPVAAAVAPAHRVGRRPRRGEPLLIVAYGPGRILAPGFHPGCPVRGRFRRVLALGCGMAMGGSGAPVFTGEGAERRLAGLVSASGLDPAGAAFTLIVEIAPTLPALREALEALPRAERRGENAPRRRGPPPATP